MANCMQNNCHLERVADFYKGKSVLITGAAGFVGVVLTEILLRCCPEIQSIYIVLRAKKGIPPEKRKEELFGRSIFCKLKQLKGPKIFDKVHVVAGDVTRPDLGMNKEDLQTVIDSVTVVFHCAACVSFLKPLSYILLHNVVGTHNVVELCRKLKRIDALVYTSTAYSNSNRKVQIEERVYRLPFPATRFLEELSQGNEDVLDELLAECQPPWPNYYTFSKCLSENLLLECAKDIPLAMVRPALICQAFKGPLPGYAEENSALGQLSIGIGKGFLKVLEGEPTARLDMIPVDVVANTHVLAVWHLHHCRSSSPLVINCSSSTADFFSVDGYLKTFCKCVNRNPLPNTFRKTASCRVVSNPVLKQVISLFDHYIPAVGLDLVLRIQGKKPRLVSAYRFLDKAMETSKFFILNSWRYETKNFRSLEELLSSDDKETFNINIDNMSTEQIMSLLSEGAPFYDWQYDKKTKKERLKVAHQIYLLSRFIQFGVIFLACLALYRIFSGVLSA